MKIHLKRLRLQNNFTQEQLSNISGVGRSYISEIETGKYIPTADILCKLCKALGCKLTDLVSCE